MAKSEGPEGPSVAWDGNTIFVVLPQREGRVIEAQWKPGITYVVRVREAGSNKWSFGFETPLTHAGVVGLKPDTEYEFSVTAKNAAGESEPAITRVRTNPDGELVNGSC